MYVHQPSGIFSSIFSDDQKNEMLIIIDERLAEIAGKAALSSNVPVNYRIEKGRIHSKILDVAREIGAQFIFMGKNSSEQEDEQEKHLGVNTSRVVRGSSCPVVVVGSKPAHEGYRQILLPLDLTRESRQKVTMGIELARFFGAGIKVVSALLPKNDRVESGRLYQQGEQVTDFISSAGIDCTFELIESKGDEKSIVPAILNYAKQQGDIDLIIILNDQELGLVEYFIGSGAQEFIRMSDIPVMTIKPKELGFGTSF